MHVLVHIKMCADILTHITHSSICVNKLKNWKTNFINHMLLVIYDQPTHKNLIKKLPIIHTTTATRTLDAVTISDTKVEDAKSNGPKFFGRWRTLISEVRWFIVEQMQSQEWEKQLSETTEPKSPNPAVTTRLTSSSTIFAGRWELWRNNWNSNSIIDKTLEETGTVQVYSAYVRCAVLILKNVKFGWLFDQKNCFYLTMSGPTYFTIWHSKNLTLSEQIKIKKNHFYKYLEF